MRNLLSLIVIAAVLLPAAASAQQLRLVEGTTTTIDPTAYRAYYDTLSGEPHTYTFTTTDEITPVTFVILVPDVPGAKTDISAAMIDTLHPDDPFVTVDGSAIEWNRFFDTVGRDSYLAGPNLVATLPKGTYEVRVWSSNNDSPYVLVASGEKHFSLAEMFRRFGTVPTIKSDFFGKPAYSAYLSPLLITPIIGVLLFLGLVIFVIILLRRRSR